MLTVCGQSDEGRDFRPAEQGLQLEVSVKMCVQSSLEGRGGGEGDYEEFASRNCFGSSSKRNH